MITKEDKGKNLNFNITNSEDEMPHLPNSSKHSSERKLFPKIDPPQERNTLIHSLKIEDDLEKIEKETEWNKNMEIIVRYEFPDFGEWKEIKQNKSPSWVNQVHWTRIILYNYYYTAIVIFCIFYALLGNNFKFICCSNAIDPLFDTLNALVFIVFIFDFIFNIVGGLDYIISFYFWTDIVSIILLIFDFSKIRDNMFEMDTSVSKTLAYNVFVVLEVLRIIRIITLSKNYFKKKYKTRFEYYTKKLRINDQVSDIMINGEKEGEEDERRGRRSHLNSRNHSMMSFNTNRRSHNLLARTRKSSMTPGGKTNNTRRVGGVFRKKEQYNESRISRRMIYLTNKRLMMVLLLMLIFVPMFSVFFWTDITYSFETDLNYLVIFLKQNLSTAKTYIQTDLKAKYKEFHFDLLDINLPKLYSDTVTLVENLREEEKRSYEGLVSYTASLGGDTYNQIGLINISVRSLVQIQSLLNIVRIFIIIFLFLLGIYFFRKDAKEKILNPLERMLSKVRAMAENPSKALALGKEYSDKYNSDITVIEDTIQKIAYLLVLGFGEAGNSLLSKILYTKNEIDFLSEANTIYGIYGFCDIRNFTDATEILTEDVLLFVNAIADVVHQEVDNNEGGANKNIGDAFLVVWRLKNHKNSDIKELCKSTLTEAEKNKIMSKYKFLEMEENEIDVNRLQNIDNNENVEKTDILTEKYMNNLMNSRICELSLISFLKTIGRIVVDKEITIYNKNKKLLKYLPNFKVKLGYGLHVGWAIEGAIGSYFKIDMSYLSPNVNMSSNLEGLTKKYGVPLLFTNSLYNQFRTPKIKQLCRKLDRIMVKGFEDPIELWTVDVNIPRLEAKSNELNEKKNPSTKNNKNKGIQSFKNIRIENLPEKYLNSEQRREGDLMYSKINEEINEENYVNYEEIQRMYEYVIMDPNLNILLELDLPKDQLLNKEIFKNKHQKALNDFITGHWDTSKTSFEELMQLKDDMPSRVIYEHMKKSDFIVPHDWKNCRDA